MNQEIYSTETELMESKATAVANALSFEELINIIDEIAPLKGSQQLYSADELIDIIKQVRNGALDISHVTSTAGLRLKVADLISLEREEKSTSEIAEVPYKVEGHGSYDFFDKVYSDKTLNEIFTRIFNQTQMNRNMAGSKFTAGELFSFLDNVAPTRERFIAVIETFYRDNAEKNSEENLTRALEVLEADATLDKMDKSFKMQRIQDKLRNPGRVAKLPDNLEAAADIIYGVK